MRTTLRPSPAGPGSAQGRALAPAFVLLLPLALGGCGGGEAPSNPQSTAVGADGADGGDGGDGADGADGGDTGVERLHIDSAPGCDALAPVHCLLPWPSDRQLQADATTETGWRLAYDADTVPTPEGSAPFDLEPYARLDGFSPASQILTAFSRPPDLSGIAGHATIERSLEDDAAVVLLDLTTGERLPHWLELDVDAASEDETMVYLRIVRRLEPNHRYAVAFRGLTDLDGAAIEASPAFAALRDGQLTDSDELEGRRPSYEDMFEALEAAGVERAGLTLAWWFHTASEETIHHDILAMRADALARLGPSGIGCTVTSVEDNYGEGTSVTSYRRIIGTVTVPSYMESPTPPTRMHRDADGEPLYKEDVEVDFTMVIPRSLALAEGGPKAGGLITFGHGLFGTGRDYVSSEVLRAHIEAHPANWITTNWAGMTAEDVPFVAAALLNPSDFPTITERLQQGMINNIAMTRTLAGVCANIPEVTVDSVSVVDPTNLTYVGGSEGGIYGTTLLTLSPDMERGVVLVNGADFPFMMERSTQYVPFLPIFESAIPRRLDQILLLSMAKHLWESTDPVGYMSYTTEGFDDIGPKKILSISVVNDAQVPNLSTDLAMRSMGVPLIEGTARSPWGFDTVTAPYDGSGLVFMDLGDRAVPEGNEPPETDDGGHGNIISNAAAIQMTADFLQPDGVITMPCDGVCDPD